MLKIIQELLIYIYLIKLFSIESLLTNEKPEGYRVERVGIHGNRVNFTWYKNVSIHSWIQAADMCTKLNSLLPRVNDMRYFYKTLQSDHIISSVNPQSTNMIHNSIVFYLGDILEATMDYPNIESGERMCLIVKKVPGAQLQLAESSAVKSCLTPANLLVCKFDMDPGNIMNPDVDSYSHLCSLTDDQRFGTLPTWILDLKQKAEFRQDHICIRQLLFYISVICSGVITIILITSTIILAVRYRRLVQKMKRRQNVIDGINVWSQSSEISSQCETDGKLDILTDSVFNRAAGGGSFARESYKEALVNSGYQRISNGRIKNLRASGKNRPGTVT